MTKKRYGNGKNIFKQDIWKGVNIKTIKGTHTTQQSFPGSLVIKNLPANAGVTGDVGLIPGSEISPASGNDNPLQYSCLENPMDRRTWRVTVHGVAKSQTQLWQMSIQPRNKRNSNKKIRKWYESMFSKKIFKWSTGAWKGTQQCCSLGNFKSKLNKILSIPVIMVIVKNTRAKKWL